VHVAIWRQAYAGLMAADYLDRPDSAEFAEKWRSRMPERGFEDDGGRDVDKESGATEIRMVRPTTAPTTGQRSPK